MKTKKKAKSEGRLLAAPTSTKKYFQLDYEKVLNGVERKFLLGKTYLDKDVRRSSSLSTGTLVLDLVIGNAGVIPGCWMTVFGPEGSAKSTNSMQLMLSSVISDIPLKVLFDYEGSTSPDYIENMYINKFSKHPVAELFGVKDDDGKYIIEPKIHYYNEDVAEVFFDSMKALLTKLPDKVYLEKRWWLRFEDNKENKGLIGKNYDEKISKKYGGGLYVETDNPSMQAIILVDSYPAMLPAKMDERDEGGGGVSEQARMFSDNVKKLRSRLRKKQVALVGVNQLRLKPMAMFSNPEYEPGGEALKFNSDIRIKFTPRVIPKWFDSKAKGQFMIEDSVLDEEGTDKYRFIHVRSIKNKYATPYLEGWIRLWTQDANGKGRGIDPVFDLFEFLRMTGQLEGKLKSMNISIGNKIELKKIDWHTFKKLALYRGPRLKKLCKKLKLKKPVSLRKVALSQLRSGEAEAMMFAKMKKDAKNKESDSEG